MKIENSKVGILNRFISTKNITLFSCLPHKEAYSQLCVMDYPNSRVESFIEHQDACTASRARAEPPTPQPACLSRTASSPTPSSDTNLSIATWPGLRSPKTVSLFPHHDQIPSPTDHHQRTGSVELQLLPTSSAHHPTSLPSTLYPTSAEDHITKLQLSIGLGSNTTPSEKSGTDAEKIKEEAREQLRFAMAEKALADEARNQASRQIELAEQEFANAKRIRQQAQVEINKALALRDHAMKQIDSTLLEITCQSCKQQFQTKKPVAPSDEHSLAASYVSSVVTEGEGENDNRHHDPKISNS